MSRILLGFCLVWFAWRVEAAPGASGTVVDVPFESKVLAGNRVGVPLTRTAKVWLPPGYASAGRRYPVVYYFHNMYSSPATVFDANGLGRIVERGLAAGVIGEVIVVAGDFTTPNQINFFGNDPVAGRWIDHIAQELVPQIDSRFRTLPRAESRAATGDFFGGFAALKLGLWHADLFGVVYALHPVGTGTGLQPGHWRPDWKKVHAARNWEELQQDPYAPIFVAMAQAYLPNPGRPPFFCDFMVEYAGGTLTPSARNIATLYGNFLLDAQLPARADSLKKLRALKMDWGRYDPTQGHVYANQAFTRKLAELGVAHFAEEYSGTDRDQLWIEGGRVEGDLLPFLARYLEGAR